MQVVRAQSLLPSALLIKEAALLDKMSEDLLDKEGVALSRFEDHPREQRGRRLAAESSEHRLHGIKRQRRQLEARRQPGPNETFQNARSGASRSSGPKEGIGGGGESDLRCHKIREPPGLASDDTRDFGGDSRRGASTRAKGLRSCVYSSICQGVPVGWR